MDEKIIVEKGESHRRREERSIEMEEDQCQIKNEDRR
jgi:hypothetical protein